MSTTIILTLLFVTACGKDNSYTQIALKPQAKKNPLDTFLDYKFEDTTYEEFEAIFPQPERLGSPGTDVPTKGK